MGLKLDESAFEYATESFNLKPVIGYKRGYKISVGRVKI